MVTQSSSPDVMFRLLLVCGILLLAACTQNDPKPDIQALLQARNESISQQDIKRYTSLIDAHYLQHEGKHTIQQMKQVFSRFDKVDMQSRDLEIRVLDQQHAIGEQTYILRVYADGEWRKIVQREQLSFTKAQGQWKISGGL